MPPNEINDLRVMFDGAEVESRKGAVAAKTPPRFPSPLIEPDVRICRIRLSDRFHRQTHGRAAAGAGRSRSTPNGPQSTWSVRMRVPRVGTFCRRRRKCRTRRATW